MLVEHSHRLAAGTVMILTLVLLIADGRQRAGAAPAAAALGGAGDGAGGGAGGAGRHHRAAAPADAGVDHAHRCVAAVLHDHALSRGPLAAPRLPTRDARAAAGAAVWLALVSAVAVYFQMVLGGLVRHSGAALACTDLPLCRGRDLARRAPDGAHPRAAPPERAGRRRLVFASSIVTFRRRAGAAGAARARAVAPVLVVVQIRLGVLARCTFLDLVTVEAHLAVATALLATQV